MFGLPRLVLLVLIGPILAVAGSVVLQVIALGTVSNWGGVAATGALVAALTCWVEWRSLLALWLER